MKYQAARQRGKDSGLDQIQRLTEMMVDALNDLLEDYKECEFELAKFLGFKPKDELAKSLDTIQRLKMAKARKFKVINPVGGYMLWLPPE
ncbi:1814_t:CDS:2 [Paraglomus brasilianum]|uniref:1814_t:CDS:1 n=1 Tax=Paraglomus brasilianum TaxID=144538 RepID=A0A9N9G3Q9_9GLOM|nr:1814_t:CDS:2 [Paraglomus brasilianum]